MQRSKTIRKNPLGRPRRRWEDNVRMNLKRNIYQYEELNLFDLEKGFLESSCECGIEPPGSIYLELVKA